MKTVFKATLFTGLCVFAIGMPAHARLPMHMSIPQVNLSQWHELKVTDTISLEITSDAVETASDGSIKIKNPQIVSTYSSTGAVIHDGISGALGLCKIFGKTQVVDFIMSADPKMSYIINDQGDINSLADDVPMIETLECN